MRLFTFCPFLILGLYFMSFSPARGQSYELEVTVEGIRNSKGQIALALYYQEDQFPADPVRIVNFDKQNTRDGILVCKLDNINKRRIALTLLDDEDRNNNMTFNMVKYPKEGFGFSNNQKPKGWRAPSFEDCILQLSQGKNKSNIKVIYF